MTYRKAVDLIYSAGVRSMETIASPHRSCLRCGMRCGMRHAACGMCGLVYPQYSRKCAGERSRVKKAPPDDSEGPEKNAGPSC